MASAEDFSGALVCDVSSSESSSAISSLLSAMIAARKLTIFKCSADYYRPLDYPRCALSPRARGLAVTETDGESLPICRALACSSVCPRVNQSNRYQQYAMRALAMSCWKSPTARPFTSSAALHALPRLTEFASAGRCHKHPMRQSRQCQTQFSSYLPRHPLHLLTTKKTAD